MRIVYVTTVSIIKLLSVGVLLAQPSQPAQPAQPAQTNYKSSTEINSDVTLKSLEQQKQILREQLNTVISQTEKMIQAQQKTCLSINTELVGIPVQEKNTLFQKCQDKVDEMTLTLKKLSTKYKSLL